MIDGHISKKILYEYTHNIRIITSDTIVHLRYYVLYYHYYYSNSSCYDFMIQREKFSNIIRPIDNIFYNVQ